MMGSNHQTLIVQTRQGIPTNAVIRQETYLMHCIASYLILIQLVVLSLVYQLPNLRHCLPLTRLSRFLT